MLVVVKKPHIEIIGDKIPEKILSFLKANYQTEIKDDVILADSLNLPTFTLGETIRFYRGMLGLTQKELAVRSGVNKNMISDMENGRKKVGYKTAVRIGEVLNRRPERFME